MLNILPELRSSCLRCWLNFEVSGFQNGYFNTVFCYYTKTNTCSQGNYYSVADKNNEIIWYDEYRFSYDRIEDWNTIQKYLMENHNIEIKKKYSK